MKKHIEDLNNKYRVLLTEVLPYELPLIMSNQQFYNNMQDEELALWFRDYFKSNIYIPFNYYVRRNGGKKSRLLSIMHPYVQLTVADFYEKFGDYMIYLCNISPFSLRHIDKTAKCMFLAEGIEHNIEEEGERIEVDKDINDYDETKYKSYFTYKDYDISYKFYESFDYLRIEQKFRFLRTLDVASCFYHIYTHSIAWAVKSKEYAKANLRGHFPNLFESAFDDLMQSMNYRETNGILVGPEISRIFAEIIFQRIDLNVLERLKNERDLSLHKDFEIKRYVDDHFVFANEEKTLDIIEDVYKDELEKFKLYLNAKKSETFERPFASNITVAKAMLCEHFISFKGKMRMDNKNVYHAISGRKDMKKYLSTFRVITKQNEVTYDILNRYQLVLFKNFLSNYITPSFNKDVEKRDPNVLYNLLEISFYIFSLDMSTTASYRICRIIEQIHTLSKYDVNVKEDVEQIIARETKRCLDIYMTNMSEKDTNMEVINLLLAIDGIVGIVFDKEYMEKLFGLNDKEESYRHLNYFQICTLMQLIKNEVSFLDIKKCLIKEIERRFKERNTDWKSNAELSLLLLDLVSCPYIDATGKDSILVSAGHAEGKASRTRVIITKATGWFFDWNGYGKIEDYLSKKEYHNTYE